MWNEIPNWAIAHLLGVHEMISTLKQQQQQHTDGEWIVEPSLKILASEERATTTITLTDTAVSAVKTLTGIFLCV